MSPAGRDDRLSPEEEAEKRRKAAVRLLNKPRGIELLSELEHFEQKPFVELRDDVGGSDSTLSERLKDGIEAGLIEVQHVGSAHGTKKTYQYTDLGRQFRNELRRRGIIRVFRKIKTLEEELGEQVEEAAEWAEQEFISTDSPRDRYRDPHL